jgi:hypothetical protein
LGCVKEGVDGRRGEERVRPTVETLGSGRGEGSFVLRAKGAKALDEATADELSYSFVSSLLPPFLAPLLPPLLTPLLSSLLPPFLPPLLPPLLTLTLHPAHDLLTLGRM